MENFLSCRAPSDASSIFVVAVVSPFLASEPTGFASASGLTEGAGAGGSAWLSSL